MKINKKLILSMLLINCINGSEKDMPKVSTESQLELEPLAHEVKPKIFNIGAIVLEYVNGTPAFHTQWLNSDTGAEKVKTINSLLKQLELEKKHKNDRVYFDNVAIALMLFVKENKEILSSDYKRIINKILKLIS